MFRACGQMPQLCEKLGLLPQRKIFRARFTELDLDGDDRLNLEELLNGLPAQKDADATQVNEEKEKKQEELTSQLMKGEIVEDIIDGVDQTAINATVKSVHTFTSKKYEDFISGNGTNDGSEMTAKEVKRLQKGKTEPEIKLRAEAATPLPDPEGMKKVNV